MATRGNASKRDSKERLETPKKLCERSDYEIMNYTEPDMERNFNELHNHIDYVATYCKKLIDEMLPICKERGDRTGLLMLEELKTDIDKILGERAKRGTGIASEMNGILGGARSTADHLSYINEVSIRIQGIVPLARRLEEIRSKLDEHFDAMPEDKEG